MSVQRSETARMKLAKCLADFRVELARLGFDPDKAVVTSRDNSVAALPQDHLLNFNLGGNDPVDPVPLPVGYRRRILPFSLDEGGFMYISESPPNTEVPEHMHDGPLVRVVMSGSINHSGKELTSGDWMYVPQGQRYGFSTGAAGAKLFTYCAG
jgi:hypothetical protein